MPLTETTTATTKCEFPFHFIRAFKLLFTFSFNNVSSDYCHKIDNKTLTSIQQIRPHQFYSYRFVVTVRQDNEFSSNGRFITEINAISLNNFHSNPMFVSSSVYHSLFACFYSIFFTIMIVSCT